MEVVDVVLARGAGRVEAGPYEGLYETRRFPSSECAVVGTCFSVELTPLVSNM